MKIRKFRAGDMVESASDSEEDKAKTAGLAASNAEKKSSGFLGLGRLFQGNIDEKGSEAYNKYGAGYGREVEAKNDQLKEASKPAAPAAASAPAASAPAASASAPAAPFKSTAASNAAASAARVAAMAKEAADRADKNDTADMKRNQSNVAGPSTTPGKGDGGARDSSRFKEPAAKAPAPAAKAPAPAAKAPEAAKAPAPAAKAPEAAKAPAPAAKAPEAAKPAKKQLSQAQQRAQAAVARATGNSSGSASSSRVPTPEEAGRNIVSVAGKAGNILSRITDSFKKEKYKEKAKGEAVKSYASGGSVSASRRGDGIAQRGKTRGKMC